MKSKKLRRCVQWLTEKLFTTVRTAGRSATESTRKGDPPSLHRVRTPRREYHGYTLDDSTFAGLLKLALPSRMIVQLVLNMKEVRTQHPLMRVPPVEAAPLDELVKNQPRLRLVVVLNWSPGLQSGQWQTIFLDTSILISLLYEGGGARLVEQVSLERVFFGSNYLLFYFESALLNRQESGLTEAQKMFSSRKTHG